jgi:lipoyl(octanoyl) transferase
VIVEVTSPPMRWSYLGLVDYPHALALQERLRAAITAGVAADTLLLLQHPPVITLGRSAQVEHVLVSEEERRRRGVDLVQVSRGGDVTYHGPGQLVGYPVRVVGRLVRNHVRAMTDSIVAVLTRLGIEAWWHEDRPGVWCAAGKIAAVGVDAKGGVAIHGFALNVSPRLDDFGMIVPCGLHAPVTSIAAQLGADATPSVEAVARQLAGELCACYGGCADEVPPASLEGG